MQRTRGFTALIFVPRVTILIPLLILPQNLHLSGTYLGIILPLVNGSAPIAIFLLRSYFRSLPAGLRESAKIDGASEVRVWATRHPTGRPTSCLTATTRRWPGALPQMGPSRSDRRGGP